MARRNPLRKFFKDRKMSDATDGVSDNTEHPAVRILTQEESALRDQFACAAMSGILANITLLEIAKTGQKVREVVAKKAYQVADEMLAARRV